MTAYYNEIDPYAAEWLQNLIHAGSIPDGNVDQRDIRDVRASDLKGFTQAHFFAGIGGWPIALRLSRWPDDQPVFSEAGKRSAAVDQRHLWPVWYNLIRECRPTIIFGEQVPEAISLGWLDEITDDLQRENYALGAAVLSACLVEAPQERERLWFMARANGEQEKWSTEPRMERDSWASEPDVARVAHGILEQPFIRRAYGNAIVPQAAADWINTFLEFEAR